MLHELHASCEEANRAFIARMRAVGNLMSQGESVDAGLSEGQDAFDCDIEDYQRLGINTDLRLTGGRTNGGDVEIYIDMECIGKSASSTLSRSQRYVLYAPCASSLGALGFFTCRSLIGNRGCDDESVVGCMDTEGKEPIRPSRSSDVIKGSSNFVVEGLRAKFCEDISALVSDLADCSKRVERDSLAAMESVMTFSHALSFSSGVGALGSLSQASVDGGNVPLAQLSQLLARHGSLLTLVASVTASDCDNMDTTRGARYKLLDIIAGMRDAVAGWFGQETNDSDGNGASRLSTVRLPERLARLGAIFPEDALKLVDTFLASTEGLSCSSPSRSPTQVSPFLLSELVVMAADGLTILWPMLFASHPELQWELEL